MQIPKKSNTPALRFPGFEEEWEVTKIGKIGNFFYGKSAPKFSLVKNGGIPCVRYGELYRSYGPVITNVISQTNIPRENLRFSNGGEILVPRVGEDPMDFAAHSSFLPLKGIAIGEMISAFTTKEDGIFYTYYFRTKRREFARMVEGGNVSNLYYSYLEGLPIGRPNLKEQKKIADFLCTLDSKISSLSKKMSLLIDYKKGCVQNLLNQTIRFTDAFGVNYPDWQERPLHSFLKEVRTKSDGSEPVFSVSVHKGLIDQVEHLGRSFSASDTSHYSRVEPGDIVYTKSPTGDFPFGIIKQSRLDMPVIVSPLYGIFRPETSWLGYWLHVYFESKVHTSNYLSPIIQKGAKNTINITNSTFLSSTLKVPVHPEDQQKVASFLREIDRKIASVSHERQCIEAFKRGLLQQMFV